MTAANMFHRSRSAKIKRDRLRNSILNPHVLSIEHELRALGADSYNLLLPESHVLPLIIRADETISGIVYGRYCLSDKKQIGRGALIATDKRVLLIDKKPLYFNSYELSYLGVSSVHYTKVGPAATVSLRTSLGDVSVRTLNLTTANNFVRAIEEQLMRRPANPLDQIV